MTTKIVVGPKFSSIHNEEDSEFLQRLDKFLSFRYAGAEFTPAFKAHRWDGMERLLSKKLEFMTGLLENVKSFYARNDKEYIIDDLRKKFASGDQIDILHYLKELGIEPYDYQLSAVEKAIEHDRIIFKHATGSGKSLTAALITAKLNKPTIIYVISKELLFQFHSNFESFFKTKIGIVGAGVCDIQNITIMSVWTVGRILGMKKKDIVCGEDFDEEDDSDVSNDQKILDFVKSAKIHHFDENHIAAAKTIQNIYKVINPEKIFGFSGTPHRDDNADMLITGIFGNTIDEVSASSLIKRGILAKPYIKFVNVNGNIPFSANYPSVYSEHIVNNRHRNNLILVETEALLKKGYQVLVLFKTIKHGKLLLELFEENGIECEFLTGDDTRETRLEVKSNLLSKESMCCIASMVYDIGVDIPTLNALILSGGGKSSVKCLQRIGRVIRDGKTKPVAAIVDFYDGVKYLKGHSKIRKSIYETEPEFVLKLPPEMKGKGK